MTYRVSYCERCSLVLGVREESCSEPALCRKCDRAHWGDDGPWSMRINGLDAVIVCLAFIVLAWAARLYIGG